MMKDDIPLLQEYAARQSEPAFATLVSRYVNLVYSTALRRVRDPHLAEEITQAVFILLARKAPSLNERTVLPVWLHRTAVYAAADALKSQRRRLQREQEAHMQSDIQSSAPEPAWELIAPLLDEALVRLGEKDRQVVLLHFFQNKTFAEVGGSLGLSEETARKRSRRAVGKLRAYFDRHGVGVTDGVLAGILSANAIQSAPAALAASVTAAATLKGAAASASTLTLLTGAAKLMAWTKTKTAVIVGVGVLLTAGTATTVTLQHHRAQRLEKIWRINKDVPMDVIDSLPPLFEVVPTKFRPPWDNWNAGANGDKFAGARARAGNIAVYAYGFPRGRIRFADPEPTNRFDFIATLRRGNEAALRRALQDRLGLVGRPVTNNQDVLLLTVRQANAPGLQPAIAGKHDTYWTPNVYHSSDAAIDTGPPRFEGLAPVLEYYFAMPVIDQTGLSSHFSIDLRWPATPGHTNLEGLKQALLEQLGLELVPTNLPVEMLVMERKP